MDLEKLSKERVVEHSADYLPRGGIDFFLPSGLRYSYSPAGKGVLHIHAVNSGDWLFSSRSVSFIGTRRLRLTRIFLWLPYIYESAWGDHVAFIRMNGSLDIERNLQLMAFPKRYKEDLAFLLREGVVGIEDLRL